MESLQKAEQVLQKMYVPKSNVLHFIQRNYNRE